MQILKSKFKFGRLVDYADILDSQRVPINKTERSKRTGKVPYYGATGQVGWIDEFIFDEELVLLGEDGAPFLDPYKDVAYLINGKSWVNNHAHVLRGKNGMLNKFLLYYLNTVNFRPFVGGTTRLKLNQGKMKEIPVPIVPTKTQQLIVDEIEKQLTRLDDSIETFNNMKNQLRCYKQSLLNKLFVGEDDWKTTPFGEMWNIHQNGISKRKGTKGRKTNVLRLADITNGSMIQEKEPRKILLSDEEIEKYKLHKSDLIIIRVNGSPNLVGRAIYFNSEIEWTFCDHFIRLSLREEYMPKYVSWYLSSLESRRFIDLNKVSSAGQNTISQKTLARLPIRVPNRKKQEKIINEIESHFSVIDKLEETVDNSLLKAEQLRKSILKSAFEGKLVKGEIA